MSGNWQHGSTGQGQYPANFGSGNNTSNYLGDNHYENPYMPYWTPELGYQDPNRANIGFPAAGNSYNNGYGSSNAYANQYSTYPMASLNHGFGHVMSPHNMALNDPSNFDRALGVGESAQGVNYQGSSHQQPRYVHQQVLPSQSINLGMANTYVPQTPVDHQVENNNGVYSDDEDAPYDEGSDEQPAGDEDEQSEEDENTDDEDIDNGEFVVMNANKKPNVERPGVVRETNGYLEWQDNNNAWHRAVIHHNIRAQLIAEAQAAYPGQAYDHPDEVGPGPHDITAFHPLYQHWGPERQDRPKILFQFDPPATKPGIARPGIMRYRGMVVLNHQHNPVLDWPIPATLSSRTSGANMQAWERTLGLSHEDIRARMVRYTFERVNGARVKKPLRDKNALVNMHMIRFRNRTGLVSWNVRASSHVNRDRTLALLRLHNFDPRPTNSIEGFGRDLTIEEERQVKEGTKGKFFKKAGARRLPDDVRQEREEKARKKEASKKGLPVTDDHPIASRRRKRTRLADESPAETDDEELPQKSSRSLRPRKKSRVIEDEDEDAEGETDEDYADNEWTFPQPDVTPSAGTSVNLSQQGQVQLRAASKKSNQQRASHVQPLTHQRRSSRNDINAASSSGTQAVANPIEPSVSDSSPGEHRSPSAVDAFRNSATYRQLEANRRKFEQDLANSEAATRNNEESVRKRQAIPGRPQKPASNAQQSRNINPAVQRPGRSQRLLTQQHRTGSHMAQSTPAMPNRTTRCLPRVPSQARYQLVASRRIATPPQSPSTQVDCRNLTPRTQPERHAIDAALQATREAYFEYTGFQAPPTDRTLSYNAQWQQIRDSFETFDWSDEPEGEAPYYPYLPPWYTTIEQWPPHPKDSMYYEAWKRGFRAPRAANGELIDVAGEFLEMIGTMEEEDRQRLLDEAMARKGYDRRV